MPGTGPGSTSPRTGGSSRSPLAGSSTCTTLCQTRCSDVPGVFVLSLSDSAPREGLMKPIAWLLLFVTASAVAAQTPADTGRAARWRQHREEFRSEERRVG